MHSCVTYMDKQPKKKNTHKTKAKSLKHKQWRGKTTKFPDDFKRAADTFLEYNISIWKWCKDLQIEHGHHQSKIKKLISVWDNLPETLCFLLTLLPFVLHTLETISLPKRFMPYSCSPISLSTDHWWTARQMDKTTSFKRSICWKSCYVHGSIIPSHNHPPTQNQTENTCMWLSQEFPHDELVIRLLAILYPFFIRFQLLKLLDLEHAMNKVFIPTVDTINFLSLIYHKGKKKCHQVKHSILCHSNRNIYTINEYDQFLSLIYHIEEKVHAIK